MLVPAKKICSILRKTKLPRKSPRKQFKRASKYKQDDLLDVIEKPPVKTPVMVTNYNPMNPNIKEIIHRNWNIITNSPNCGPIFQDKNLIGFRRLPQLKGISNQCNSQITHQP